MEIFKKVLFFLENFQTREKPGLRGIEHERETHKNPGSGKRIAIECI